MAHFAELNENNQVLRVIVVNNDVLNDNGQEHEELGIVFCQSLYGKNTKWTQTSYNGTFRKNYAGIGYTYDAGRDAFIPPQSFPSWTLNESSCLWESPVPYPSDDKMYSWDEDSQAWVEVPGA